ncbi:MAG: pyridoxal-dependent decarboxylase [Acidobacteriota bacterium]
MIARIRELETIARRLEPASAEREALIRPVLDYTSEILNTIGTRLTYIATEDKGIGIYDSPISDTPVGIQDLLAMVAQHVDRPGINPASGGHLGYIPGGGIFHSALGDYLADITNRYAGIFFASPGAVRMEHMLTRWMAEMVGFPETAAGNLTSGGSIANLIGVVTARDARRITALEIPRSVIYLTTHAHHSVDKAIRIAGLRECVIRHVLIDAGHRMDADALERMVVADLAAGLRPFLIVASAGTTDVGAVDPLPAIGDISERHGLWLHVDGAYGAFFALCEEGRKVLQGMDRADSIVMDPHKGLFLPYGSGAVLVKDTRAMQDAHFYVANYMQDAQASIDEASPADLSPELTKHFRGMRLWLPLKLLGVGPFRAALEEKLWLARYFRERLLEIPGFEVGPPPDLSVATFRYLPPKGDVTEFNQRLVQAIHADGRVFLSSSIIDDQFTIRLAVLAFRTHLATIDLTLKILNEKVAELLRNQ